VTQRFCGVWMHVQLPTESFCSVRTVYGLLQLDNQLQFTSCSCFMLLVASSSLSLSHRRSSRVCVAAAEVGSAYAAQLHAVLICSMHLQCGFASGIQSVQTSWLVCTCAVWHWCVDLRNVCPVCWPCRKRSFLPPPSCSGVVHMTCTCFACS
jgi:hypothetical protein